MFPIKKWWLACAETTAAEGRRRLMVEPLEPRTVLSAVTAVSLALPVERPLEPLFSAAALGSLDATAGRGAGVSQALVSSTVVTHDVVDIRSFGSDSGGPYQSVTRLDRFEVTTTSLLVVNFHPWTASSAPAGPSLRSAPSAGRASPLQPAARQPSAALSAALWNDAEPVAPRADTTPRSAAAVGKYEDAVSDAPRGLNAPSAAVVDQWLTSAAGVTGGDSPVSDLRAAASVAPMPAGSAESQAALPAPVSLGWTRYGTDYRGEQTPSGAIAGRLAPSAVDDVLSAAKGFTGRLNTGEALWSDSPGQGRPTGDEGDGGMIVIEPTQDLSSPLSAPTASVDGRAASKPPSHSADPNLVETILRHAGKHRRSLDELLGTVDADATAGPPHHQPPDPSGELENARPTDGTPDDSQDVGLIELTAQAISRPDDPSAADPPVDGRSAPSDDPGRTRMETTVGRYQAFELAAAPNRDSTDRIEAANRLKPTTDTPPREQSADADGSTQRQPDPGDTVAAADTADAE